MRVLAFCVALAIGSTAGAQSQPTLEILTRQGDFYWVVETAPDGSRKGGWVNALVPLDRIDRNALKPIPALPPLPSAPQGQQPDAASVNERLAKIEQALAAGQGAGPDVATPPVTPVQSAPRPQVAQSRPQPFTSGQRAAVLRDVKAIQVDPTVIANPDKVKEDFAANLIAGFVKERAS